MPYAVSKCRSDAIVYAPKSVSGSGTASVKVGVSFEVAGAAAAPPARAADETTAETKAAARASRLADLTRFLPSRDAEQSSAKLLHFG
jgi:hypothetical protein